MDPRGTFGGGPSSSGRRIISDVGVRLLIDPASAAAGEQAAEGQHAHHLAGQSVVVAGRCLVCSRGRRGRPADTGSSLLWITGAGLSKDDPRSSPEAKSAFLRTDVPSHRGYNSARSPRRVGRCLYFFLGGCRCLLAHPCKSFTWPWLSLGTGGIGGFDPPRGVEIEHCGPVGFPVGFATGAILGYGVYSTIAGFSSCR